MIDGDVSGVMTGELIRTLLLCHACICEYSLLYTPLIVVTPTQITTLLLHPSHAARGVVPRRGEGGHAEDPQTHAREALPRLEVRDRVFEDGE